MIVEGPISAILAGRNAVASYGKTIAKAQIELLRQLAVRQVTIVSEFDAREQSLALAKALSETYDQIFLLPMPRGHDPASLGREKFNAMRHLAIRYDRYDRASVVKFILA
jgi:DNA primase